MNNILKIKKAKNFLINKIEPMLDIFTITINIIFIFSFFGLIILVFYKWNIEKTDKILDFLKATTWPAYALIFTFIFKANIAKFIDRIEIKRAKILGNEIECNTPREQENSDIITKRETADKEILAKYEEKITYQENNIDKIRKDLVFTKMILDLERIYNVIFGTQIILLDYLKKQSEGLPIEFIDFYFKDVQKKFIFAFREWTLFKYLKYLEIKELIIFDYKNRLYKITKKGEVFLKHIEIMNYPKNKNL